MNRKIVDYSGICDELYHVSDKGHQEYVSEEDISAYDTIRKNVWNIGLIYNHNNIDSFLDGQDGRNMARNCNFDLVHSSLISFLNGERPYNLEALRYLETFLAFSTASLIIGYVYLGKYSSKTSTKRGDCCHCVKLYLVCCLIATKYIDDTRIFSDPIVSKWGFCMDEINHLEMNILLSIDFDLHVSEEKVVRMLKKKIRLLRIRKEMAVIYSHIVEWT